MQVKTEQISHPGSAFRVLELDLPAFSGAWHRHPQVELTWIQQGQGVRYIGDSIQPFEAGDLVLLAPNVPHVWLSTADCDTRCRTLVVQFSSELLPVDSVPEWRQVESLLRLAERGLSVTGESREMLLPLMQALPAAPALSRLANLVDILHVLSAQRETLIPITDNGFSHRQSDAFDARLQMLIQWIRNNLSSSLAVADAASLVHISPAAFSRFFKRAMGKPFSQYVNDLRCLQASMQLRDASKPIARIAFDSGFSTLSHFNLQFRLRYRCSPREFRRQCA